MKKTWKMFLCMALAVVFSVQLSMVGDAAPKKGKKEYIKPARFARVAILPVINLVEDESIDYSNTLVFQKAIDVFTYPDYEIYDNEKLYQVLEEMNYYEVAKDGITREMLQTIMERSGADMVVAVKLNELKQEYYPYGREDQDQLTLDVEIKALFSWREEMFDTHKKIKEQMEYAAIMKTDWKMREYGRTVGIYLERIAKLGKK